MITVKENPKNNTKVPASKQTPNNPGRQTKKTEKPKNPGRPQPVRQTNEKEPVKAPPKDIKKKGGEKRPDRPQTAPQQKRPQNRLEPQKQPKQPGKPRNMENSIKNMTDKVHNSGVGEEMRNVNSLKELFMYLRDKFFKKAKKLYYLVPPCPECGSYVTGRFFNIKKNEYDNQWIIKEGLKNGEILAPIEKMEKENVFCAECGNTWHYDVTSAWLSYKQVDMQKEMRGTRQMLRELSLSEMEEQPKKSLIGGIKKYIGHI